MTISKAYSLVRGPSEDRDQVIHYIYNNEILKSKIRSYILKNGGNVDDAEFIYSDMIVQCIKTMFTRAAFEIDGSLDAYLMGIAKYLWLAELKYKNKLLPIEKLDHQEEISDFQTPEKLFLNKERQSILKDLLNQLRGNCREVLMHWSNGFNMEEIAQKLNYQSEGMARKKKSQCLKELLEYLANHPHIKNLVWR